MPLTHTLDAFSKDGVFGCQCQQRDWSPYLVHLTSWEAMTPLREALYKKNKYYASMLPKIIHRKLATADQQSFGVFQKIMKGGFLKCGSPSEKKHLPECVCFAECNLPGLISHAERYGRFGFVFEKLDLFQVLGARPCLYLERTMYNDIKSCKCATPLLHDHLFGLSNIYDPIHRKKQDYTHEREWRVFADVPLLGRLKAVLCPKEYVSLVVGELNGWIARERELAKEKGSASDSVPDASTIPVIPMDMLFEWGA